MRSECTKSHHTDRNDFRNPLRERSINGTKHCAHVSPFYNIYYGTFSINVVRVLVLPRLVQTIQTENTLRKFKKKKKY